MNFVINNREIYYSVKNKLRDKIDKKISEDIGSNIRQIAFIHTPTHITSQFYNHTLSHLLKYEFDKPKEL